MCGRATIRTKDRPQASFRQLPQNGDTLFRGLRHRCICADGLDALYLTRLTDDQLRSLMEHVEPTERESEPSERALYIDQCVRALRNCSWLMRVERAWLWKDESECNMGREIAAAALAADSDKCRRALNGETVALDLCASMLARAARPSATDWHNEHSVPEAGVVARQRLQHQAAQYFVPDAPSHGFSRLSNSRKNASPRFSAC